MAINNAIGFTTIATDSGSAVISSTAPGFSIVGGGDSSTSASGSTITVTTTGSSTGVIQQQRSILRTALSTASTMPSGDTIPQNTDGVEVLTATITPTDSNNIIEINFSSMVVSASDSHGAVALFQDSTANALAVSGAWLPGDESGYMGLSYYMTAGTTSATTFKIRAGSIGTSAKINSSNWAGADWTNLASTVLTVTEWDS